MQIKVNIVSPGNVLYEGNVALLVLPGKEGELGIMHMHENAIIQLTNGRIRIFATAQNLNNTEPDYALDIVSGYAHVTGMACSVIVNV
ncbi:ATP synthase epsilon chain [Candidatus Cyrtobacter comes]|uniref:ATP synthase epsilon chain n=1 Tax=Candidatus Cyrtobacter comes TaxID=675776 RepID=A0ABU5L709_9RICK|nr:hypothetical protein [Candidatus Cyrtobacter comes]MDZ5761909.1 ATP synthase epsilon chain [Candidatus Cyrtobacter comes]